MRGGHTAFSTPWTSWVSSVSFGPYCGGNVYRRATRWDPRGRRGASEALYQKCLMETCGGFPFLSRKADGAGCERRGCPVHGGRERCLRGWANDGQGYQEYLAEWQVAFSLFGRVVPCVGRFSFLPLSNAVRPPRISRCGGPSPPEPTGPHWLDTTTCEHTKDVSEPANFGGRRGAAMRAKQTERLLDTVGSISHVSILPRYVLSYHTDNRAVPLYAPAPSRMATTPDI